jgi:hypothetical protein
MLRPGLQRAAAFVEVRYQPFYPLEVRPSGEAKQMGLGERGWFPGNGPGAVEELSPG